MSAVKYALRVAVLWVMWALAGAYSMFLYMLVEPTALEEALAGEMDGMALDGGVGYYLAGSLLLGLGMAVLTVLSDSRGTRIANLVVALAIGIWGVLETVSHLVSDAFSAWMLVSGASVLVALLIAGLSAAALRKPATGPPAVDESVEHRETTTV
jgi:hypothetical protein